MQMPEKNECQNGEPDWTEKDSWLSAVVSSYLFTGLGETSYIKSLLKEVPPPAAFKKGEYLYTRREFQRALGILLEGRVEITREEEGRKVVMNLLKPGGIFGAAALYGNEEEYVTDIRAVERCTVLFLSQEHLSAIMEQDFRVAENYIRFLSGRIRFLNQRIAGFTGGAADRRLALYLLEHRGGNGNVLLPRSMVDLAAALNVGRSSLYRSLDALSDAGIIARTKDGIAVLDLHRLQAVVE